MGILEALGTVIILASCVTMITTPVTAPIWFVVGLILMTRPGIVWLWRTLTVWHMLSFLNIGLFGLVFGIGSRRDGARGFVFFFMGTLLAGLTYVAWQASRRNDGITRNHSYVVIQLIVAVIAAICSITLLTSKP